MQKSSKIDEERGDIPRSRYILRPLDIVYLNARPQGHEIKIKDSSASSEHTLESRNP